MGEGGDGEIEENDLWVLSLDFSTFIRIQPYDFPCIAR